MSKKLAIIPARKGSKGIPGKNWKILGDKPLIQHTIDSFIDAKSEFDLLISTDDKKIMDIADLNNIQIHNRSEKSASDNASMFEVVQEIFDDIGNTPDQFLLLQPTSPFRSPNNIRAAIEMLGDEDNGIVGMKSVDQYQVLMFMKNDSGFADSFLEPTKFVRRQDLPKYYYPTGSIYLLKSNAFLQEKTFYPSRIKILEIHQENAFDIDNMWDWCLAELIYNSTK